MIADNRTLKPSLVTTGRSHDHPGAPCDSLILANPIFRSGEDCRHFNSNSYPGIAENHALPFLRQNSLQTPPTNRRVPARRS